MKQFGSTSSTELVVVVVDFDFVLGADGVKILKPKTILTPKFFYYYLKGIDLKSLGLLAVGLF